MKAEVFAYLKNGHIPDCWGPPLSADEQRLRDMEEQREQQENARQEAVYRRAAWRSWEPIPQSWLDPDPPRF
jgi:hypothetical protein